jgi:hypothetical protein
MKKLLFPMLLASFFAIGFIASDEDLDNPVTPQPQPVTTDKEAPSLQILSPTSDGIFVTTENSIEIAGTAQDNDALESITYTTTSGKSGTADGLENWTITDLTLADGDNFVTVTATDKSKNTGSANIVITKNQYLNFLDAPYMSNNVVYTNTPIETWITIGIAPNEKLIESSVTLIEVGDDYKPLSEICRLYDDGNLNQNGDEIKGDNVFSAKYTFNYPSEGTHKFRVSAQTQEENGAVTGYSAVVTLTVLDQETVTQQVSVLVEVQQAIEKKLTELSESNLSAEEKEAELIKWLMTLSQVASVEKEGTLIKVVLVNGLVSYISVSDDEDDIKGGISDSERRASTPAIPLSLQTRGTYESSFAFHSPFKAPSVAADETIILNKNVLVWAPFENSFKQDMGPVLFPIFDASPVSLNVEYQINEQCTTASLCNLAKYGIIVFDTHGSEGKLLLTREKPNYSDLVVTAITSNDTFKVIYEIASGGLNLITMEYYREDLGKKITESFYAVTPRFIKDNVNGTMPNSIVFNGSCQSMKTNGLANAFIAKGAKTYLGFKETVLTSTCNNKAVQFFTSLVGPDLKTTGESYIPDIDFYEITSTKTWLNSYLMSGSQNMRFRLGLINGDFEYGSLIGWNYNGDGRVITQLGSEKPIQGSFMGIVSTGLGYTENYGSIWQTFLVSNETTLSLKWNFLSEEFMEYVGSQYQDYLKITIIDGDNTEVIYNTAIDGFANKYDMTKVSPTIVFDRGDVYMTGWKTSTFDISKYQGKTITLLIECGDIGDSIYDSATLLDEITVY